MSLIGATVTEKIREIFPWEAVSVVVLNDIQVRICTELIESDFKIRVINHVDTLCAILKSEKHPTLVFWAKPMNLTVKTPGTAVPEGIGLQALKRRLPTQKTCLYWTTNRGRVGYLRWRIKRRGRWAWNFSYFENANFSFMDETTTSPVTLWMTNTTGNEALNLGESMYTRSWLFRQLSFFQALQSQIRTWRPINFVSVARKRWKNETSVP